MTTDLDVGALPLGASIAVDGVCLTTVIDRAPGKFAADLGPETLARDARRAARGRARSPRASALRLGDALGGYTSCRATSTAWARS